MRTNIKKLGTALTNTIAFLIICAFIIRMATLVSRVIWIQVAVGITLFLVIMSLVCGPLLKRRWQIFRDRQACINILHATNKAARGDPAYAPVEDI